MTDNVTPTQADLIDTIIAAYHTTRLSDTPAAHHILSKPQVRAAFASTAQHLHSAIATQAAEIARLREALAGALAVIDAAGIVWGAHDKARAALSAQPSEQEGGA